MVRASGISVLSLLAFATLSSGAEVQDRRPSAAQDDWIMYVGTYTHPPSKGIFAYRFQPATGTLTSIGWVAETTNPTFLAIHPSQHFLYAVNEVSRYQGQPAGSVSSFSIDAASGQLKLLNQVSSRGPGPCHVALDKTGHWLFVANYSGGSIAAFPVHGDGTLGEASAVVQHSGSSVNPRRQTGPHAHVATLSPDNRFVVVADLGLDQVLAYRLDPAKGGLAPNDPGFARVAPGSGPRHVAFRPDGRFAYVVNEMLSTVTTFRYDAARGSLQELETVSTLPANFTGNNAAAEIALHPSAKFLYASNRGHDSIAIFRVDPAQGTLTAAGQVSTQGKTPRNFAIDPTGAYLLAANQDSATVVAFRINQQTGGLSPAGTTLDIPSPACITFASLRRESLR